MPETHVGLSNQGVPVERRSGALKGGSGPSEIGLLGFACGEAVHKSAVCRARLDHVEKAGDVTADGGWRADEDSGSGIICCIVGDLLGALDGEGRDGLNWRLS